MKNVSFILQKITKQTFWLIQYVMFLPRKGTWEIKGFLEVEKLRGCWLIVFQIS